MTFTGKDIDLERLIETRMLISANSGGGKSYCLRNLLETTHGKVQQIVLDMEGEFGSLREKYDYVLIGKGGDLPADVRSAPLLAKKLLELKASAIIDLYELHQHERIRYVKLFLEEMVNAPKELWHPVLVVLDEAHIFAPEKRESEALTAVADMATRGRKREYCLVAATQRLSKLNKDVAAELNNVLIGRTGLDIDMKRASESLGFTSHAQSLELRSLSPGEFFAYGPAISNEVKKVKIGAVQTSHSKPGQRANSAPAAPKSTVLAVLDKLKDLPQRAQEELRTIDDHKREIANLRRELTNSKRPGISVEDRIKMDKIEFERGHLAGTQEMGKIVGHHLQRATRFERVLNEIADLVKVGLTEPKQHYAIKQKPFAEHKVLAPIPQTQTMNFKYSVNAEKLDKCARVVLSFLYHNNNAFDKKMLGLLTGYSHSSGGFNNTISKLNASGLISKQGDMIQISNEGLSSAPDLLGSDIGLHKKFTIEHWKNQLPICDSKVFSFLLENRGEHTREEIGEATGYSHTSGGFNNSISHLHALGLIIKNGKSISLRDGILDEYS